MYIIVVILITNHLSIPLYLSRTAGAAYDRCADFTVLYSLHCAVGQMGRIESNWPWLKHGSWRFWTL